MAVTAAVLTSGGTATPGTSASTASISPTGNRLILVLVMVFRAAGSNNTPSVTGAGLTGSLIAGPLMHGINTEPRVYLYRAMSPSPSSGALTIGVTDSHDAFMWQVLEFAGVDTSGTNGSGAIVQSDTEEAAPAGTTLTSTLAAFASSGNATFGGFRLNGTAANVVPGSGFTQLAENDLTFGSGEDGVLFSEFKDSADTTVDASWDASRNCNIISVEIKAASGTTSTEATLLASVASNIQDNTTKDIQAAEIRSVLSDIIVSMTIRTTRARGATSVADGGTISHGLSGTPTTVVCSGSVAGEFVSVTAKGASNFTVAIKKHDNTAGTTQTVNWIAEL